MKKRHLKKSLGLGIACLLATPYVWSWTIVEEPKTESLFPKEVIAEAIKPSEDLKEELSNKPIIKAHNTGTFEKKAPTLEPEEIASQDFHAAIKLMNSGSTMQGEQKLVSALRQNPEHQQARVQLATLYLKQDRELEAEVCLQEGLQHSENDPELLRLQALVYERQSEPEKALKCLNKLPSESKSHKTIMSLKANLFQQVGQYKEARQHYMKLLKQEPHNSAWLLGLSIALDSEGDKESAIEGYKQLQARSGLEHGVLEYVANRLNALKG